MPLAPSELRYDSVGAADFVRHRMTAAQFYAWGRTDERPSQGVDAYEFRAHYGRLAGVYITGKTSFVPSVQETWDRFTTCHGPAF